MIRKLFPLCLVCCLLIIGCKISGTVSKDGVGLEGVSVTLRGGLNRKTTTDTDGRYAFNNIIPGKYYVSASGNQFTFDPVNTAVEKSQLMADIDEIDFFVTAGCDSTVDENTNYVACGKQHEITEPSDLLDENGALIQTGWMRRPLLNFNPENLAMGWERGKWWIFYGIVHDDFNLLFFIADLGYSTLIVVSFADLETGDFYAMGDVILLTKGELGLSNSSMDGDVFLETLLAGDISIERDPDKHVLNVDSFLLGLDTALIKHLEVDVNLAIDPSQDSMVVATSFREDPRLFFYDHKANLLPTTGSITFNGKTYALSPENAYGHFDWGRGVWPYKSHWYWATGAGTVEGHDIWFNIGYGFGDLSTHTENMIFYDGKCHKIDQVTFYVPDADEPEKPWTFTSNDDRLELTLDPYIPIVDDQSQYLNAGVLMLKSNRVIGYFSGYLILDDGTKIEFENMHGHSEEVEFRW